MTLISRLRFIALQRILINEQRQTIDALRCLMDAKESLNDRAVNNLRLDHLREIQGMASAWLISLEKPEMDIREDLVALESKLGHQIAALEEHVV